MEISVDLEQIGLNNDSPRTFYADLLIEIIKYILFVRGQIPSAVDNIQIECEDIQNEESDFLEENEGKRIKKRSKQQKQAMQFIVSINRLFSQIDELFNKQDNLIYTCSLVFGSTYVTPKEAFTIHFQYPTYSSHSGKTEQVDKNCVKKVLRSLVSQLSANMMRDLPPTKMFLMINASRSLMTDDEQTETDWIPKQSFDLNRKIKKLKQSTTLYFNSSFQSKKRAREEEDSEIATTTTTALEESSNKQEKEEESSDTDTDHDHIWYQSNIVIRGFK